MKFRIKNEIFESKIKPLDQNRIFEPHIHFSNQIKIFESFFFHLVEKVLTVPTHNSDTPNTDISQNSDTLFALT